MPVALLKTFKRSEFTIFSILTFSVFQFRACCHESLSIQRAIPTCDIVLILVILSSVIQCFMMHAKMMSLSTVIKIDNEIFVTFQCLQSTTVTVISVSQLIFLLFHACYCRFRNTEGGIDNDQ